MSYTDTSDQLATREQNCELAEQVIEKAKSIGLGVTRYSTGYVNFDGVHRYALIEKGVEERPHGTRSKKVIQFYEARYSRYHQPNIKQEKICLNKMLETLEELSEKK